MIHGVADRHAEGEQDNLCDDEECGTEEDIADGPAVFQCSEDEDELRNDVNGSADYWPKDVDDKQSDRFCELETCELFESRNGNEEGYAKHNEACKTKRLHAEKN